MEVQNENSIDFRLYFEWPVLGADSDHQINGEAEAFPDYHGKPTFHLAANKGNNDDQLYARMHIEDKEWEAMKALNEPLDERIVECYLDEENRWRFLRWRNDKHEANHISTVESVMESIEDSVSEEQLMASSRKMRDEWKKRQAAADARAKAEASARQAPNGHTMGNGQREVGAKRKLEDGNEGADDAKRVRPP